MAEQDEFIPGPILLIGAPGVGKGTQAKAIAAAWGIPQISTGDILRWNVTRKTELGKEAEGFMQRGELVPDDVVNSMVSVRLFQPDTIRGFILDGYPRTVDQAKNFDVHVFARSGFESLETSPSADVERVLRLPVIAVNLRVGYTELLRRVTGRRICSTCGDIYNVYLHPPRVEGVCDRDGTTLTRRQDDTEEVFEGRMRSYHAQTSPVVERYRGQERLVEVDGEQPVEQVTAAVLKQVQRLRGA